MRVIWTTRDARTHRVRLGLADYMLGDLEAFREFTLLFQFCFAQGGGPWVPAAWMWSWFLNLDARLQAEREVLPFRYGADGDFGGGQSVVIDGQTWSLQVGSGECSLTFASGRVTKWIDLRGQSMLQTDGRPIRLQRRKQDYRWYGEMPGLLRYFQSLPQGAEVRTWSINAPVPIGEVLRIADEEPGGVDAALEILIEQREKGRHKLAEAAENPRFANVRPTALSLLSLLDKNGTAGGDAVRRV
jgi:hypothetical protein